MKPTMIVGAFLLGLALSHIPHLRADTDSQTVYVTHIAHISPRSDGANHVRGSRIVGFSCSPGTGFDSGNQTCYVLSQ